MTYVCCCEICTPHTADLQTNFTLHTNIHLTEFYNLPAWARCHKISKDGWEERTYFGSMDMHPLLTAQTSQAWSGAFWTVPDPPQPRLAAVLQPCFCSLHEESNDIRQKKTWLSWSSLKVIFCWGWRSYSSSLLGRWSQVAGTCIQYTSAAS